MALTDHLPTKLTAPTPRKPRLSTAAAAMVLGTLFSIMIGSAGYTFVYARGWSYLGNNPATCANCHIMQDHLDGWSKSSHHAVATCNDCHTPHDLLGKYWTKADHGFWHSYAFTTGDFHEPIQMSARSRKVTEQACHHCHADLTHGMTATTSGHDEISCLHCHNSVGHLR